MAFDPISAGLKLLDNVIDRVVPDKNERMRIKAEARQAEQAGDLEKFKHKFSIMLAEAKSSDPWTSRARPSFLYVMYILILASIPMGLLAAFKPLVATAIADGMKQWLAAIPDGLWATFAVGYSGYTVARSAWDKRVGK